MQRSQESISKEDTKPPVTGDLRVFVSEAKNIGVRRFSEFLRQAPGREAVSNELRVGFDFRAPQKLENAFKSEFVNDTLLEDFKHNLKDPSHFLTHVCEDNPNWRTPDKPAGDLVNLGKMIKLPKSNAYLRLTLYSLYRENGQEDTFEYGSAE